MKELWVVDKFGTYLREINEPNTKAERKRGNSPVADKLKGSLRFLSTPILSLGMLITSNHISPPQVLAESNKKLQSSVQSIPIKDGVFITENGVDGFAVTGPMAEVFRNIGGPAVWGQPISQPYRDNIGRENQAFEKGVLQISPDGKGGINIEYGNIFDELSKQGKDGWLDSVRQTPPPFDWSSDAGRSWEGIVENHFLITDPYPALKEYILRNPDWLNMYGLPMSIQDYEAWVSLRMQRTNLQLYTQDVPWVSSGQILVANGGSVAKEAGGIIPQIALGPQLLVEVASAEVLEAEPVEEEVPTEEDIIPEEKEPGVIAEPTPEPTATVRPTPTLTPTPELKPLTFEQRVAIERNLRPIYTQFLDASGIMIKAPAAVDRRALERGRDIVLQMTARPDVRSRMTENEASLAVIPRNVFVTALPEFSFLRGKIDRNGNAYDSFAIRGLGGVIGQPITAASEESLLRLQSDPWTADGIDISVHEFAHGLENLGLSAKDKSRWIAIHTDALKSSKFPQIWGNLMRFTDVLRFEDEYFAELSRLYFKGNRAQIRSIDPDAYNFLESIYNPK